MPEAITAIVLKGSTPEGTNPIPDGTIVVTPDHQPNVHFTVLDPFVAIAIRFANAYLTTLIGLVTAGMTTTMIPNHSFLDLLWKCAGMSLAGPGVALLKDLTTVFGKLENKYPLITGNV